MKKSLFVLIFAFVLSACSTKFGYNNIDWLIYWYMDDYVELTSPQERIFDQNVKSILAWHRTEELGKYKAHLADIRRDIKNDKLNEATIYAHLDRGRDHLERVRREVSPQLVQLADELSDDQVTYLFAALEQDNREQEEEILEELEDGELAIIESRIDNVTDDLEDEIGRLTDEQNTLIAQYAPKFKPTGLMWIAYRRNIQGAARLLFTTRKQNPEFEQQLLALMLDTDYYRSEEYKVAREHNRKVFMALLTDIVPTVSLKQKQKLTKRIDDIIADLDDLSQSA
jgi:hypothetical protein